MKCMLRRVYFLIHFSGVAWKQVEKWWHFCQKRHMWKLSGFSWPPCLAVGTASSDPCCPVCRSRAEDGNSARRFHLCRGCSLCNVTMGRLSQHWPAGASARPAETDDEKGCCRKKDPPYFLPLVVFDVCLFVFDVSNLSEFEAILFPSHPYGQSSKCSILTFFFFQRTCSKACALSHMAWVFG